ncbi:MAG: hypothetical protein ACRDDF_00680, partial [Aeromonas sp.]
TLCENQGVLIKNESKRGKGEDTFKDIGKVVGKVKENVYKVRNKKGNIIIKHVSQLKGLRRGKLDTKEDRL